MREAAIRAEVVMMDERHLIILRLKPRRLSLAMHDRYNPSSFGKEDRWHGE
jgi:hypothetical protein